MKNKLTLAFLFILSSAFLSGCKKDDDGDDDVRTTYNPSLTWTLVGDNLTYTNLYLNFPYNRQSDGTEPSFRKIKRYEVGGSRPLIPVKLNNVQYAAEALDRIEAKLGRVIFDRTSIASADESTINYGLIFRQNTAVGAYNEPHYYACGHVGAKNGDIAYEMDWYDASTGLHEKALSVNIGPAPGGGGGCTTDVGLVVHEVMHALGMAAHFDGYGMSPSGQALNHEGDLPYTVLYNIYFHPAMTPDSDIELQFPFGQDEEDAKIQGRRGVGDEHDPNSNLCKDCNYRGFKY